MKIAILLHGLAGSSNKYGTGDEFDVSISHKHYIKNILDVSKTSSEEIVGLASGE